MPLAPKKVGVKAQTATIMGTAVCGSNISGTTVNANHTVGNAAPVSASLAILMFFFHARETPLSHTMKCHALINVLQ